MKKEIDIYDPIEEIHPPKKQINPKIKKVLIYLACGIVGILLAAGIIVLASVIFTGASTPEKAIAE